jgi:hypothetical protein
LLADRQAFAVSMASFTLEAPSTTTPSTEDFLRPYDKISPTLTSLALISTIAPSRSIRRFLAVTS